MVATASILDLWPDLVDDKTGIVRAVKELFIDDDEPAFVHYLSYACDTSAFGFLPNFGNNGGVGTTARSAIAKALGEAVERYCSALFRYEDLEWAAYGELDLPATHPETFALYSAGQYAVPGFSWQRFTVDTRVAWVRGTSLVSCEVIERDAFTRTWQAVQQRPRIEESTLPAQLLDLIDRYAAVDLAVHLLDITSDVGAPTILSVAEGFAATSPAIAVAAAPHPDPVVAVRKSLKELAHTRKYAAQVMDYLPPVPVDLAGGHPQVDGQRAHLRFYCPQEAKSAASFLWSSELRIHLDEVARPADDELSALVAAVAATGQEVVAVELTSPDIADLGLHVVRVIVPGFHPLQMGHSNRCLGGDRLAADLWVAGRGPDDDNPYPHPFP